MNMTGFKAWYQSIGIWGSLGTIVVGILDVLHIAHGDTIQEGMNTWSAALAVVIGGLISLYGRIRATRQIGPAVGNSGSGPGTTFPLLLIVGIFAMLLTAGGCASPRSQWAVAQTTLNQTEHTLVSAHQAGLISDKDFLATEPFVKASRAALERADAELAASGPDEKPSDKVKFYLDIEQATVVQLNKFPQLRAAQKGK
jgi:hypothetical protein